MKINNQPTLNVGKVSHPNFKMHAFLSSGDAMQKFATKNNFQLLQNKSANALDMFLTQNMKVDGKFYNHLKYYTETILNRLRDMKVPENLIGHPQVAVSEALTPSLLPKDDDTDGFDKYLWFTLYPEAPSDCEMSGKDFHKMFYSDDPHCIRQGNFGDCYLLAVLDSLSKKWRGFDYIQSLFHKNPDMPLSIIVKNEKPDKNYHSAIFKLEKLFLNSYGGAKSPNWVKYLEVAFSDFGIPTLEKYCKENKIEFSKEKVGNFLCPKYKAVGEGGWPHVVMDIFGLINIKKLDPAFNKKQIIDCASNNNKYCTAEILPKSPYIGNPDLKDLLIGKHAYSLHDYDSEKKEFIISNPHWSCLDYKIPELDFEKTFTSVTSSELPPHEIWANPHDKESKFHASEDDSNTVWTSIQ